MERGTHTNRVTLKIFLAQLCPFFDLEFLLKNGFTAISQELMDEF